MFLEVIGRPLPAQASAGFGVADWIVFGVVIALFVAGIVVPNLVARRASRSRASGPEATTPDGHLDAAA